MIGYEPRKEVEIVDICYGGISMAKWQTSFAVPAWASIAARSSFLQLTAFVPPDHVPAQDPPLLITSPPPLLPLCIVATAVSFTVSPLLSLCTTF